MFLAQSQWAVLPVVTGKEENKSTNIPGNSRCSCFCTVRILTSFRGTCIHSPQPLLGKNWLKHRTISFCCCKSFRSILHVLQRNSKQPDALYQIQYLVIECLGVIQNIKTVPTEAILFCQNCSPKLP